MKPLGYSEGDSDVMCLPQPAAANVDQAAACGDVVGVAGSAGVPARRLFLAERPECSVHTDPVRLELVRRLRNKIEKGEYRVSSSQVAERLMRFMRR